MTKEQADIEAHKIFREIGRECDEAIAQAKKNGTYIPGLDTNRELFEPIHKRGWERIQRLAAMIDE